MNESNYESNTETAAQTKVTIFETSTMYWKLCSMFLGFAFLVAIASHGGPASANAGDSTNLLSFHQQQAAAIQAADASQSLSIGGFDSVDGEPVFVILNEQRHRIGTLPMNAVSSD